jgi:hypothetical protein
MSTFDLASERLHRGLRCPEERKNAKPTKIGLKSRNAASPIVSQCIDFDQGSGCAVRAVFTMPFPK